VDCSILLCSSSLGPFFMIRIFEEESKAAPVPSTNESRSKLTTTEKSTVTTFCRWPGSRQDAGILILSDDEDDEE